MVGPTEFYHIALCANGVFKNAPTTSSVAESDKAIILSGGNVVGVELKFSHRRIDFKIRKEKRAGAYQSEPPLFSYFLIDAVTDSTDQCSGQILGV